MQALIQEVSPVVAAGHMKPTPERLQHHEIVERNGVHRVVNTVHSMYEAGDIGDDEVSAADRWYREYLFATIGIVEEKPSDGRFREKGDVHTWMIGRGKCSVRIAEIRERLGLCGHVRLEMMLAREMSFSAMARHLYPGLSEGRARMKVSAQCALLLEQLSHAYESMKNKN
ncbi:MULTISPECIES: hypothetical protein [unclassified Gluconobacter]|uniref:hypothetical protein n=1 Tax=unclassified Gluconobacter TaxID=2644261 RepID=UPI001C05E062|nr:MULTISPECIES: hypothetical protein [unclassified Gluconobacter]